MPELPEVETTRQGIAPIIGLTITNIWQSALPLRQPLAPNQAQQLQQQQILNIVRRGKYLLAHTSHDSLDLLIHLGMSGSLRLCEKNTPFKKHDHISFTFINGQSLRYHDPRRFGFITTVVRNQAITAFAHMGVEPLEQSFNAHYLYACAQKSKSAIKNLIMNQKIVVGVGNIYANEALFFSRIHPNTPAQQLTLTQCAQLVQTIKNVLTQAIAVGGTTLKDFVYSDGSTGYFQQTLNVYGKEGKPCPNCNTQLIMSTIIGGRNSYFCPNCQPL